MTEATARELRERVSVLEHRMATLRGLCPSGVEPEAFIRHLADENRRLREERGRDIYDSPSMSWE